MENYIQIVNKLNCILDDKHGETGYRFTFTTDGYEEYISFGDKLIWHREYDEREWDENIGDYKQPLLEYCKNKFNEYIKHISKLKL